MIDRDATYTLRAAAGLLGVEPMTVWRWAQAGLLQAQDVTAGGGMVRLVVSGEELLRATGGLPGPFASVQQVAVHYRVSPDTVRRWCEEGKLLAWRIALGGDWHIDAASVPVSESRAGMEVTDGDDGEDGAGGAVGGGAGV